MMPERIRFKVTGIVQGVGFRPFIYSLARSLFLNGSVSNTGDGVVIEAEGTHEVLEVFLSRIRKDAPPLSYIKDISIENLEFKGYEDFKIETSISGNIKNTFISPDVSICGDCKRELFDVNDFRHLYPFINCTNCGPRFTIITDVPYDRPNTTMSGFVMCETCKAQYSDPHDRRYHAQPVSCSICGPKLLLLDRDGNTVTDDNAAGLAGSLLAEGYILAIKGLGGYHLACDASNPKVVYELRKRKHRDEKPFALMTANVETAIRHCLVNDNEKKLLESVKKPIVLLEKRPECSLPDDIAPGNRYLGIMLPYTPVHLLLFGSCPDTLVMTSGNISSEPICYKDDNALTELHGIADYFLINNREIHIRTDDSVTRSFMGREYIIRRARGYVPMPVVTDTAILPVNSCSVLACGGELKNTFCLNKSNEFYLSHHIGDLENLETLQSFEEGILHFKRLFDIEPEIIAYDLHPGYISTKYALSNAVGKKIGVQHHHAHIASCMAENGLSGNVIGVAFDGTGYGEDGNIWGSEFFTGTYGSYERAGHLEYVKMPGGDAAVREPWRMAVSYLYNCRSGLPGGIDGSIGNTILRSIEPYKMDTVIKMLENGFNCPATSSMGRLFDAVSALAGVRSTCSFEGQAAIELEYAACKGDNGEYGFIVEKLFGIYKISVTEMILGIINDAGKGISKGIISSKFHKTLVAMVNDICCRLRSDTGYDRVVLSGGVFQNILLLSGCIKKLGSSGFHVFIHSRVPANDGGISLGQTVIAMAKNSIIC